jgi:hypothetical protein
MWRQLLPQWPVVSRRFWLTLALLAVATLNLCFLAEIWPNTPQASLVWRVVAYLAAGAVGIETLRILWRWAATYTGPKWAGVLFRFVVTATVGGLAMFGAVLFIGAALFAF